MLKTSCQKISEMRSQSTDGKVRVVHRVRLWWHTRLCRCQVCQGLQEHLTSLRTCVQECYQSLETRYVRLTLDESARERMTSAMEQERVAIDREKSGEEQA